MIISDEQVRRSLECLERGSTLSAPCPHIPDDVVASGIVEAALRAVDALPDVRFERVAEARTLIERGLPDSGEVAGKLLGRAISDALR